jgi:carboxymethylenebutenolidase
MSRALAGVLALTPALALPQDAAQKRLESSPRHQEWVAVRHGERTLHAFLVFPEAKATAPAVVVIHENRGLTDWVRSVADRLAEAGVIAIAPDLLSGAAPAGGKTSDFPSSDAAREAISKLPGEQVSADLNAVADHALKLPGANGRLAVAGFCWGGAQAFRFATQRPGLAAAFVFYGTAPQEKQALAGIRPPVYGFYGGNDARVNATLAQTGEWMKELGLRFEPVIYDGAGHGFLRAGEEPDATEANRTARDEAWARWLELLKTL